MTNVESKSRRRHLEEKEIVLFVTQDLCKVISGTESTTDPGQFMFIRLGRARNKDLRECYLDVAFPTLNNEEVASIKLCMYQYYTDVKASPSDKFSMHTFKNTWNENKLLIGLYS